MSTIWLISFFRVPISISLAFPWLLSFRVGITLNEKIQKNIFIKINFIGTDWQRERERVRGNESDGNIQSEVLTALFDSHSKYSCVFLWCKILIFYRMYWFDMECRFGYIRGMHSIIDFDKLIAKWVNWYMLVLIKFAFGREYIEKNLGSGIRMKKDLSLIDLDWNWPLHVSTDAGRPNLDDIAPYAFSFLFGSLLHEALLA